MKLLNILFFAIPEFEYDFVQYRSKMESTAFSVFTENGSELKFLKLHEPGYQPADFGRDEFFFTGKNSFFSAPLALLRFVKKEKPDVVFVHGFIFPFQMMLLQWYISNETKLIVQHHAEKPFKHPVKRWFQKHAYSKADACLFSSVELAGSFLKPGIIPDTSRVHEVMEGSCLFKKQDKQAARNKLDLGQETTFLWVGRLNENKDPYTVLKAIQEYSKVHMAFKLYMIYGSSEMEAELKAFVTENKLQAFVVFVGSVPHEKLETWYSAADYFIAASHYEGSGIALCEAMACGCIPIVSRIASFIAMSDNGQCGYLFERSDVRSLFSILNALNPDELEIQSARVVEKFRNDLSFEAIGRKIFAIARQLTGK